MVPNGGVWYKKKAKKRFEQREEMPILEGRSSPGISLDSIILSTRLCMGVLLTCQKIRPNFVTKAFHETYSYPERTFSNFRYFWIVLADMICGRVSGTAVNTTKNFQILHFYTSTCYFHRNIHGNAGWYKRFSVVPTPGRTFSTSQFIKGKTIPTKYENEMRYVKSPKALKISQESLGLNVGGTSNHVETEHLSEIPVQEASVLQNEKDRSLKPQKRLPQKRKQMSVESDEPPTNVEKATLSLKIDKKRSEKEKKMKIPRYLNEPKAEAKAELEAEMPSSPESLSSGQESGGEESPVVAKKRRPRGKPRPTKVPVEAQDEDKVEREEVDFIPREGERVLVVDSEEGAREVVGRLMGELRGKVHAIDTEVSRGGGS